MWQDEEMARAFRELAAKQGPRMTPGEERAIRAYLAEGERQVQRLQKEVVERLVQRMDGETG